MTHQDVERRIGAVVEAAGATFSGDGGYLALQKLAAEISRLWGKTDRD